MSGTYCAATQLVDKQVLPAQFSGSSLERDNIWELQEKMKCTWDKGFDGKYQTRVTLEFEEGERLFGMRHAPRSVEPGLTNKKIVEKWRGITKNVMEDQRWGKIEKVVLDLENLGDLSELAELLGKKTSSPIAG